MRQPYLWVGFIFIMAGLVLFTGIMLFEPDPLPTISELHGKRSAPGERRPPEQGTKGPEIVFPRDPFQPPKRIQ